MTVKDRIVADLTAAMKAKDTVRLGVLRMLKAKLLEAEVEQRAKHGPGHSIEDADALGVLSAYAKQRRDSVEAYRAGARTDLAEKEEAELAIVLDYLPRQLSADEIATIVRETIAESGATSMKDMGNLMKAVLPKLKGMADGKVVNDIVRKLLGS